MRIAITGSMGVGKTTLAKQISNATGIRLLPEVARELIKAGHKLDEQATPELEEAMAECQQELENSFGSWVADRCLFDILAYTMVLFPKNETLIHTINRCISKAKYGIILYIPPEFPIKDDGVRSTNKDFQKKIDDTLKQILHNVHIIRGSRKERLKLALKIINENS